MFPFRFFPSISIAVFFFCCHPFTYIYTYKSCVQLNINTNSTSPIFIPYIRACSGWAIKLSLFGA
jgi:hypothetical protein